MDENLAFLIGSRICHDLVSPLGAISNGVELLTMTPGSEGPEIALISESVAAANARIRFFRVAYGAAKSTQFIEDSEISATLADVSVNSRLHMKWSSKGAHPRNEVRLIFLLLQCLETSMPQGGEVTVTGHKGAWSLSAEADVFAKIPVLWDAVTKDAAISDIDAAHVQFALASILRRKMDLKIEIADSAGKIKILVS